MKIYMYGMQNNARDDNNYFVPGYIRDLYLEEMTFDMRDEYYNVLCYKNELDEYILDMYGYEYIGTKEIEKD